MASTKPLTKPLVRWSILILRAKAVWIGDVEAASEAEAIKIGADLSNSQSRNFAGRRVARGRCTSEPAVELINRGTIMKLTLMRAATTIAIALFSATASQGQSATRYAISGRPLKLGFADSTNPDCSTIGRPTIRIIRAPEHGRVTVSQTRDFPSFPVSNIRSECNRRRVSGAAVYYVSQHGFLGTDYVDVEIIFVNGELRHWSYTINVR